jgi:hypothetical protein
MQLVLIEIKTKAEVATLLRDLANLAESPDTDFRSLVYAIQDGPTGFRTGVCGHYRRNPIDALPALEALRRKLRWELSFKELA